MIDEKEKDILQVSIFDEFLEDARAILRGEDISPERDREAFARIRAGMGFSRLCNHSSQTQGQKVEPKKPLWSKRQKMTPEQKHERQKAYQREYYARNREVLIQKMRVNHQKRRAAAQAV